MFRDALSKTLASLPEDFHHDRAELLAVLQQHGILHRSPTQPVLSRDGTSARWMLDSLSVTLSPPGSRLAGRCVLELLKRFDGHQIATYGLTGVPILQSCVLQAPQYTGLLVRKERKPHGSLKLIEGQINYDEPVVLIDDSVSSGLSMTEGTERLEAAGLRVEGGVCLVRFGWYGGYAQMQERGYHMEAVYDIWEDFIYHMEDEDKPLANPSKWFSQFEWSARKASEDLHPATLAREVISEYLSSGQVLRPPTRLDRVYDSAGGAWVSLRSRADLHRRFARDGFWHFPGDTTAAVAEDVVMAALQTAQHLPAGDEGLALLRQSGIAVTFFGPLEKCSPGELDNDRYGIVVRSLERPERIGGALPRMPGIRNEWEQFQHARIKNAQLVSFEPFDLFRHEVVKAIEPETAWQPTGVPISAQLPWHDNTEIAGTIARRARDLVLDQLLDRPQSTAELADDLIAGDLDSLYLTVYVEGNLRGCMGGACRVLDDDLKRFARAALDDDRFTAAACLNPDSVAVTVSFLFNPLEMGDVSPDEVVRYYRHGDQGLMAYRGDRLGLLLPFVASTHNFDPEEYARAVLEKAGLETPPFYWCRFDCATWLADSHGVWPTAGGFKIAPLPETAIDRYASWHVSYLLKQCRADGDFYSSYHPFQNRLYERNDPARLAYGVWVLARSALGLDESECRKSAVQGVAHLLKQVVSDADGTWLENDSGSSVSELAFLLLALLDLPQVDGRELLIKKLQHALWASIALPHGRISTHRNAEDGDDIFQDYFPGQVLLALACAAKADPASIDSERLARSFQYYRHRFLYRRHFGQVSWFLQAFSAWWLVTRDPAFAEIIFEIADWLLEYQQSKTGGFINDHQSDSPGFTTAVYLEGIAAALPVAKLLNESSRADSYLDSFTRGFQFLDRLIIQPRDESMLPNIDWALGGLRQSLNRSEIRIDFVQHSLSAILYYRESANLAQSARATG
jgi:AMMECR1 domain-containing protein/orotate phosphoribosyltransferase